MWKITRSIFSNHAFENNPIQYYSKDNANITPSTTILINLTSQVFLILQNPMGITFRGSMGEHHSHVLNNLIKAEIRACCFSQFTFE